MCCQESYAPLEVIEVTAFYTTDTRHKQQDKGKTENKT